MPTNAQKFYCTIAECSYIGFGALWKHIDTNTGQTHTGVGVWEPQSITRPTQNGLRTMTSNEIAIFLSKLDVQTLDEIMQRLYTFRMVEYWSSNG